MNDSGRSLLWREAVEKNLRLEIRMAITSGVGRCSRPPFTPDEVVAIWIDEVIKELPDGEHPNIEGYEKPAV
jgi:hypothetical protein